jgi:hypothetical protein
MYLIIISLLLAVIASSLAFWHTKKNYNIEGNRFFIFFSGLGTFGLLFVFSTLVSLNVATQILQTNKNDITNYDLVSEETIVALKNSSTLNGHGFIFLSINSQEEYVYYVELNDGSYVQRSIPTNMARIIEDNDVTPRIERWQYTIDSNWVIKQLSTSLYKFYIPEGSLVREFHIE